MREFRLAQRSLRNIQCEYRMAGLALQAAMKRERLAFTALDDRQRAKVLTGF